MIARTYTMAPDEWMRFVVLSLVFHRAVGNSIATANVSDTTTVTALQWGQRSAYSGCNLQFPGITVTPGSYIFARFDVKIISFLYYLGASVIHTPPSQWVIARSDTYHTSSMSFTFQFTYDEYLGTGKPTGDCTLFVNETEAVEYAQTVPDLVADLPSRKVSIDTPFSIVNPQTTLPGWDVLRATCLPNFAGTLGLYEIYTYVNFNMQVYNVTSTYGTDFVAEDPGGQWYFGLYKFHGVAYATETYEFWVPDTSSKDYENGTCSLYALTNDTVQDTVDALLAATWNATLNATAAPPNYNSVQNYTHSGGRNKMQEDTTMRNQFVTEFTELWTVENLNPLMCGRLCLKDADCLSVFFSAELKTCHGHSLVYTKGDSGMNYTSYYVVV